MGTNLYFFAFFATTARNFRHIVDKDVRRLRHLYRQGGIDNIGGREPFVDMARSRADVFGDIGGERDDIVIGRALDLADAFDIEFRATLDGREVFPWNLARLASQNLDLKPDGELVLLRPDIAHHLAAVSPNHDAMRLADDRRVVNVGGDGAILSLKRRMAVGSFNFWPVSSTCLATRYGLRPKNPLKHNQTRAKESPTNADRIKRDHHLKHYCR